MLRWLLSAGVASSVLAEDSAWIIADDELAFMKTSLADAVASLDDPPHYLQTLDERATTILPRLRDYNRCDLRDTLLSRRGNLQVKGPKGLEGVKLDLREYRKPACLERPDLGNLNERFFDCSDSNSMPSTNELVLGLVHVKLKSHAATASAQSSIVPEAIGLLSCDDNAYLLVPSQRHSSNFQELHRLDLSTSKSTEDLYTNAVLQVVNGLGFIQSHHDAAITLYEVTPDNLCIVPWPIAEKTITYNLVNKTVSIPNLGFRVLLMRSKHVHLRFGKQSRLARIPNRWNLVKRLLSKVSQKVREAFDELSVQLMKPVWKFYRWSGLATMKACIDALLKLFGPRRFFAQFRAGLLKSFSLLFELLQSTYLKLTSLDPRELRLNNEREEGKSGRTFDLAHFMRSLHTERSHGLYRNTVVRAYALAESDESSKQIGSSLYLEKLDPWCNPLLQINPYSILAIVGLVWLILDDFRHGGMVPFLVGIATILTFIAAHTIFEMSMLLMRVVYAVGDKLLHVGGDIGGKFGAFFEFVKQIWISFKDLVHFWLSVFVTVPDLPHHAWSMIFGGTVVPSKQYECVQFAITQILLDCIDIFLSDKVVVALKHERNTRLKTSAEMAEERRDFKRMLGSKIGSEYVLEFRTTMQRHLWRLEAQLMNPRDLVGKRVIVGVNSPACTVSRDTNNHVMEVKEPGRLGEVVGFNQDAPTGFWSGRDFGASKHEIRFSRSGTEAVKLNRHSNGGENFIVVDKDGNKCVDGFESLCETYSLGVLIRRVQCVIFFTMMLLPTGLFALIVGPVLGYSVGCVWSLLPFAKCSVSNHCKEVLQAAPLEQEIDAAAEAGAAAGTAAMTAGGSTYDRGSASEAGESAAEAARAASGSTEDAAEALGQLTMQEEENGEFDDARSYASKWTIIQTKKRLMIERSRAQQRLASKRDLQSFEERIANLQPQEASSRTESCILCILSIIPIFGILFGVLPVILLSMIRLRRSVVQCVRCILWAALRNLSFVLVLALVIRTPWLLPAPNPHATTMGQGRSLGNGFGTNILNEPKMLAVPLGMELTTPDKFISILSESYNVMQSSASCVAAPTNRSRQCKVAPFGGPAVPVSLPMITRRHSATATSTWEKIGLEPSKVLAQDILRASQRGLDFFFNGDNDPVCPDVFTSLPSKGDLGGGAAGQAHSVKVTTHNPTDRVKVVEEGGSFRVRSFTFRVEEIDADKSVVLLEDKDRNYHSIKKGDWHTLKSAGAAAKDSFDLRILRILKSNGHTNKIVLEIDLKTDSNAASEQYIAVKAVDGIVPKCSEWNEDFTECSADINEVIVSMLVSKLTETGISPHFVKIHSAVMCDARDEVEQQMDQWNKFKAAVASEAQKYSTLLAEAGKVDVYANIKARIDRLDSREYDYRMPTVGELSTAALGGSKAATQGGLNTGAQNLRVAMELIHGDMWKFQKVVSKLQYLHAQEHRSCPTPTSDQYVKNALFQVFCALETFHEYFHGMHNDLHPGNVFIKLVDDDMYGSPGHEKPLKNYTHFEYNVRGVRYRIPNLGFVVKIGDMGLSTIQVQADLDEAGIANFPQPLDLAKRIREISMSDESTTMGRLLNQLGLLPMLYSVLDFFSWPAGGPTAYADILRFLSTFIEGTIQRSSRHFNRGWDLGNFMSNLMADDLFFAHPVVERYREINNRQIAEMFGEAMASMHVVDLRHKYTYLSDIVGNIPTKFLPRQKFAIATPFDMISDPELFKDFRVDDESNVNEQE